MKIKNKIFLISTSVLLMTAPSLAVLQDFTPNSTVQAAKKTTTSKIKLAGHITDVEYGPIQVYDKNGKPYRSWNHLGSQHGQLKAASTITAYGNQKYIRGPKIYYYGNRTDPATPRWLPYYETIKGKRYVYLGKGQYIPDYAVSIYPLHRHMYITQNTAIYDKNGKKIKNIYPNKKVAWNSKQNRMTYPAKYNKKFDKYHYEPAMYFYIGNGGYIKSRDVIKINGHDALYINHNAAVYDHNGKKTKDKNILKSSVVKASKNLTKISSKQNPAYFVWQYNTVTKDEDKYTGNYQIIKGKAYYQISKNRYISAANVGNIAGKTVVVNRPITVKIAKNSAIYAFGREEANKTKKRVLKKGTKVTFDYQVYDVYIGESEEYGYYHIKGKKNEFIYGGNVKTRHSLIGMNWYDYYVNNSTATVKTQTAAQVYALNGSETKTTIPSGAEFTVDQLRYLYIPSEKKAELFYHITNETINDDKINVGNGFVKASAVKYVKNLKLKAVNTAKDAKEESSALATTAEKEALTNEINKETSTKKSYNYQQSSATLAKKYDHSLASAKEVQANKQATKLEVNFMSWYLSKARKDLDGTEPFS